MATYHVDTTLPYLQRRQQLIATRTITFFAAAATAWFFGATDWIRDLGTLAALCGASTVFGLRAIRKAMRHSSGAEITITAADVRRTDARGTFTLQRADIASFAEPAGGRGLAVRAMAPARTIVIPADLANYEGCRAELEAMGIPRVSFAAPGRRALSGAGVVVLSSLMLLLARNHTVRLTSGVILGLAMIASALLWPNRQAPAGDGPVAVQD